MEGLERRRTPCVGICLDDRSDPHAWQKRLAVAGAFLPCSATHANALRVVSSASFESLITLPLQAKRRRLCRRVTWPEDSIPAKFLAKPVETRGKRTGPSPLWRPVLPKVVPKRPGLRLPRTRAARIAWPYSDDRRAT